MLTKMQSRTKPAVFTGLNSGHSLARGLAGCWILNEGAGRTVRDVSGHRHHGLFSGNPTWSCGTWGRVVELDGNDDWISMGDCLDLGTDDVTLLTLVKYNVANQPDDWSGTRIGAIAGKGYLDSASRGYGLLVSTNNKIYWQIRNLSSSVSAVTDSALNDDQWHIVIGVCDRDHPTGVRLYVDNALQNTTADATSFSGVALNGSRAFAIGSRQDESPGTWFWDFAGSIAMVGVWKRVLTEMEIRDLQRDPFGMFAPSRSLSACVPSGGATVPCSGSLSATASLSAQARVVRKVVGTAIATASLNANLSVRGMISLSATVCGRSILHGALRTRSSRAAFTGQLRTVTPWRREALFNATTHDAFKWGTSLTQGWFWMRRRGCTAVYRSTNGSLIDFSRVLHVAASDVHEISLPSHIPHAPGSTYRYFVRRLNSCGHQEKTMTGAVVRIGADGKPAGRRPNRVVGFTSEPLDATHVRLLWFYCPLNQEIQPERFHVYRIDGSDGPTSETRIADICYQGRTFYSCDAIAPTSAPCTFSVRAVSPDGIEGDSVHLLFRSVTTIPQPPEILVAAAV